MIPLRDPMAILAALLAIEGLVLWGSELPYVRGVMKYVPSMFWIYFLPMVAATTGLLPPAQDAAGRVVTDIYGQVAKYCLPACLVLLLVAVDVRSILRLGPKALTVMLAGSLGIFLGAPLVLMLYKPLIGESIRPLIWKGFGSLSASWIGGSANMITVGKALDAPGEVFLPMVVVDTICPYAWMCAMIILSRYQRPIDRLLRADDRIVDELKAHAQREGQVQAHPLTLSRLGLMVLLGVGGTWLSLAVGDVLPVVPNVLNAKAWSLILATALGIALSFTPLRRLEPYGASRLGYALLYLVLASIGSTTSLRHLAAAPILIVAGFTWIAFHALVLLGAGRLLRVPMSLLATASQANIGGPASAPVLAEVYVPGLAPVGLLLAVLGNILGTYLGLLCAAACRLVN